MKQAIVRRGQVYVQDVPAPVVAPGAVLVNVAYSCISAGTEASVVRGSGQSVVQRALQQPERIGKAARMVMTHGVRETWAKISAQDRWGQPIGYSVAGVVLGVGGGVTDLHAGQQVAAAGAGSAVHAEIVSVPRNLVAVVPPTVTLASASTVALGSIALQGVRRGALQLGELVVVYGTGLLGLLTVQMVRAAGCRCVAVDVNPRRLTLAGRLGAEILVNPTEHLDPVRPVFHASGGHGADAVIFTALTDDPQVLSQALAMTRRKGRLVMVGVYGNEVRRDDLYQREIDFLVSTSYGPGRYDQSYELKGHDYPYAFVRWTENRNMDEFLRLLGNQSVEVEPLVEASYPIDQASEAFARLQEPDRPLAIRLTYAANGADGSAPQRKVVLRSLASGQTGGPIRVGIIGAGGFARAVHLPHLKQLASQYTIAAVCNRTGATAQRVADEFGAGLATTDPSELIHSPDVDLIMICTRHDQHGALALASLEAGKHTFVEKPLCTTGAQLEAIREFFRRRATSAATADIPLLVVGFNRRFSGFAREARRLVADRINPLYIHYRMNAGYLPPDHWVHGPEGGGRIVGEACHALDTLSYLVDARVRRASAASLVPRTASVQADDNRVLVLEYEDGSLAVLDYVAVGASQYPKELVEIHYDEKTIVIDDYRSLSGYGVKADARSKVPDKGHRDELIAIGNALQSGRGESPIPLESLFETTALSIELQHAVG